VAIHDTTTDAITVPPDPDTPLQRTDTLIVAGSDEALDAVTEE